MNSADEQRVLQLHEGFIEANKHEDVDFLTRHTNDDVTWFNLNKSNYIGRDEILALWRMLYEKRPDKDKDANLAVTELTVDVVGDAAWLVYLLSVDYDFGDLAKVSLAARTTEIWQRLEGDWKLVHFHCSEHEPGNMGGR